MIVIYENQHTVEFLQNNLSDILRNMCKGASIYDELVNLTNCGIMFTIELRLSIIGENGTDFKETTRIIIHKNKEDKFSCIDELDSTKHLDSFNNLNINELLKGQLEASTEVKIELNVLISYFARRVYKFVDYTDLCKTSENLCSDTLEIRRPIRQVDLSSYELDTKVYKNETLLHNILENIADIYSDDTGDLVSVNRTDDKLYAGINANSLSYRQIHILTDIQNKISECDIAYLLKLNWGINLKFEDSRTSYLDTSKLFLTVRTNNKVVDYKVYLYDITGVDAINLKPLEAKDILTGTLVTCILLGLICNLLDLVDDEVSYGFDNISTGDLKVRLVALPKPLPKIIKFNSN